MSKPKLHIVIASTRPGRVGPTIARWFHAAAVAHGGFDAELVDLAEFNLPVYDEPNHPKMQKYEHAHTKRWSASVGAADAFVFVIPEYNFNAPPALVNALNYVYTEWNYKPASFVSYGFVSGGLRSVESVKPLLAALKVVPLVEQVVVPVFTQNIKEGEFVPGELHSQSATQTLDELLRWSAALSTLRG